MIKNKVNKDKNIDYVGIGIKNIVFVIIMRHYHFMKKPMIK